MAFTWVISQLDSIPSVDGMNKVISTIHWRAQKQESDFTADTYGATTLEAPHESSFTPYNEVTKEMVHGWLESSLDLEAIEANLDSQIENFVAPSIVAYNLPWQDTFVVVSEPATEETPAEEPTTEEENIPE